MYKYYIVVLFAFLSTSLIKVNANVDHTALTRDSIGIENEDGKKVIIHRVVAKDTYYSIGRRYKVPYKTILDYNDNKFLQIGVIIKVPTDLPFEEKGTSVPGSQNGSANEAEVITYTVQPKDNLHALSIKYGTTVDEIKKASNISSINLSIGQVLKIPQNGKESTTVVTDSAAPTGTGRTFGKPVVDQTPAARSSNKEKEISTMSTKLKTEIIPEAKAPANSAKKDQASTSSSSSPEEFVEHIVASNETMYSIASKYKMTVAQLMAKNKMVGSSLTVGQHLLIKGEWPKEEFVPAEDNEADSSESIESLKNPKLKYPSNVYGLNEQDEKGTAVWISDQNMDATKMYVLHRTAQIGTVMKITNPMSNRTTFAKVVGKFTENESTKDVIVVMTKAVAESLGALDKRFFCNISYRGEDQ